MSNDTEAARRHAESKFALNPQTPKASDTDIQNAELRNAHNAEIERQRHESDRNR